MQQKIYNYNQATSYYLQHMNRKPTTNEYAGWLQVSMKAVEFTEHMKSGAMQGKWTLKVDGIYGNNTRIAVLILWDALKWNKDGSADGWRVGMTTINKIK